MKVVYVTGCLGFIGSYVTRACLEKGWQVRGVDKMTYAANVSLLDEFKQYSNFVFEKQDIKDMKWLYDCDYVINTAAETHVDNSIVNSGDFVESNIKGVHNLLELIKSKSNYKMPTLLHFSTDEVYGDILEGSHRETDMLSPSNPYSATKAAADQLVLAWARTHKVPYVIVRPSNNYGVGQYVEKLVPKTCKYLNTGQKIPVHDGGNPTRIWLHAKDTANGVIKIIESGARNDIFNISGGFEQKNLETITKTVEAFLNSKDFDVHEYIDVSYSRVGHDVRYSIDDSKLRNLGWKPECSFDDEIGEIVRYYTDNFVW